MLHQYCSQFLAYCQLADFSARSIQALTIRLNEFKAFLKSQRVRSVKKITYQHLINFVSDHKDPSIHVRKSRVWTLRQFFHFLTLHHSSMGLRNLIIIMLHITTNQGFGETLNS
ncbi:MAG: site-specific integrase [Deltaproteobacteria bacterium]|nr:site-specific integrase [Deltaproteobacteria bacterium]